MRENAFGGSLVDPTIEAEAYKDAEARPLSPVTETVTDQEFVPMGARLVIKEDSFKYEGLIKIPGQAERRPTTGTIVALGPNVPVILFDIGDHVLYASFAGTLVESRRTKTNYRIIAYDEILAKLPRETSLELEAR